jgi:hypothetical protein
MIRLLAFVLSALTPVSPGSLRAQEPPVSTAELSESLLGLLRANMPAPLFDKGYNWGKQREVIVGVKWKREGLLLKPETIKKLHNDGVWRKIRVEADAPDKLLQLSLTDLKQIEEGKVTFQINVVQPVHIHFEQQVWESGIRLYSGSTRARCKVGAILKCEMLSKVEFKNGLFLPEISFRTRVTEAKLGYDDLVVEHTLGIGGDGAKLIGEAVIETIRQAKPSLEEELLLKGNKAIVKAGDTKEIKLGLSKLVKTKK